MGLIDFVCLAISLPTASTLALYLLINKGTDGSVFTDRQDGGIGGSQPAPKVTSSGG